MAAASRAAESYLSVIIGSARATRTHPREACPVPYIHCPCMHDDEDICQHSIDGKQTKTLWRPSPCPWRIVCA